MILLLPPTHSIAETVMRRNGFTKWEEIEPQAGCRRFRLS